MALIIVIALAGTASATTITSPAGTAYTGSVATSPAHGGIHMAFVVNTCTKSTLGGSVEKHGVGLTAGGNISTLGFENCTYPVTILKKGSLEVHSLAGGNGTVTSSGAEISILLSVGTCIFTTNATDIGTLTGGTTAKFTINSAKIPRAGGSAGFLCGSAITWTGSYTVNTPDTLFVG